MMIRALLAVLVTVIGCRDPVSSSPVTSPRAPLMAVSAPEIESFRLPYPSITIVGPCTGEEIALSGEFHIVTKVWRSGDSFRLQGHTNLNVAGIGLSTGRSYRLQQITNSDQEFELGTSDAIAHQIFHLHVIAQGAAANWYVTMNGEFRFSAGGFEFTPRKWETVCQ